jgi:hypothetical protein
MLVHPEWCADAVGAGLFHLRNFNIVNSARFISPKQPRLLEMLPNFWKNSARERMRSGLPAGP